MSNCFTEEKLLDLVVGELPESEADAILTHTRECDQCRQAHAEFKFSVSFFQNRLGDIPDMPKQLSQHHFKEIITTARELEAELPNIWGSSSADVPEPIQPDYWGRTIAWSVAAVFAIAFGIALFVKRPWDAQTPTIVEVEPSQNPAGPAPQPPAPKIVPPTPMPKPEPNENRYVTTPKPNEPVQPEPTPKPEPDPRPEPIKVVDNPPVQPKPVVVVKQPVEPTPKPPGPAVVPEPKEPDVVVDTSLVAITLHSMSRNQLPRHLRSTPGTPDESGLKFTSTGYVRKISAMEAKQFLATTSSPIKDKRELYELEYKTDDFSAKRLIDLNEQILMSGGSGARSMTFKPRSRTLEIIGNRQELMTVHRAQDFLCNGDHTAINLSIEDADVPTQNVSKHRAGVLYSYKGLPVDAKQLAASVPPHIMRQIKAGKVRTAVAKRVAEKEEATAKLDDDGPNDTGTGKDNDTAVGKDGDKDKGKGKAKPRRSTNGFRITPRRRRPSNNKPIPTATSTGGIIDWQQRSDALEESPVKVNLTPKDFGGISEKTIRTLRSKKISKKSYTSWTFDRIMNSLCKRADIPFIDLSDQSDTKLTVKLESVTVHEAIETVCQEIDVLVTYSAEGVIVSPHPAEKTLQTAVFKLGPAHINLRESLRQSDNPKTFLMQRGINFPPGAGVSVTRNQKELIIHNSDAQLRKAIDALDLGRWD